MSEQVQPEIKSGAETTEFKLTRVMMAIGLVLEMVGGYLATMPQDVKWVAITSAVLGAAIQVFTVLGYMKGRAQIKAAATLASPWAASASGQPSAPSSP